MQLMTAKQAKNSFGELMNTMQREPVFITKNNKPVGAFVSLEDLKGTHIVEAFETDDTPTDQYKAYITEKLKQSFKQLQDNDLQGVSVAEASNQSKQQLAKRLATKK